MAEPTQRRTGRRIAIAIAVVVAVPLLLVAVALALLDSGAITKRVMDAVLPRASAALGRDVTVRGAELDLFPHPRVRLDGLTVAGREGEPPLVSGDGIQAEVALWPLLASLGRTVEVRAVVLEKPVVNLVRGRDGVWNYEGLGGSGPAAAEKEPPPAEGGGAGTNVVVRRFAISDGAVRIVDRSAGADDAGVALEAIGLEATDIGTGLPLAVKLRAALAAKQENLAADLSVSALPSGLPQRPEDWPQVTGSLSLKSLALDRLRPLFPAGTSAVIRGGTVGLEAKVATEKGAYRVDGSGDLRDLRLRGQAASGRFRAVATAPLGAVEKARVELPEVAVRGPGVDLSGNATLEQAPLRARFALRGPLLDLDALMGALPPSEAADEEKPAAGGEVLPAPMRKEVRAATASGTLELGELRSGKLRATDVKARAVLRDGVLVLENLAAGLFGGKLDASGTRVSLAEAEPTWSLSARVEKLDLGEALRQMTGSAPVVGKTDLKLAVSGKGIDWEKLKRQVTGAAALAIEDGALTTADLGGQVLGAVATGLRAVGKSATAERVGGTAGKTTSLQDLAGNFAIKDGWLAAEKPIRVNTPVGPLELGGKIGLDMRLDLAGSAAVSRDALARIAPSGVKLPQSLLVPLGMGGTLGSPSVAVRADEAVKGLLRGQAQEAKKAIQQEAEKKGRDAVDDLLKKFRK